MGYDVMVSQGLWRKKTQFLKDFQQILLKDAFKTLLGLRGGGGRFDHDAKKAISLWVLKWSLTSDMTLAEKQKKDNKEMRIEKMTESIEEIWTLHQQMVWI